MKKETEETDDQYPWLDKDNERRNMSDNEILEKYADLQKNVSVRIRKERNNGYAICNIVIIAHSTNTELTTQN